MVKVIFHALKEIICSLWEQIFSLREVPLMKRDAIELNHCFILYSPSDVPNFFSVLATPLNIDLSFSG